MKKLSLLCLSGLVAACNAGGTLNQPIARDLYSERAIGFLNPEIELSFGRAEIIGREIGTFTANRRTNGSNKNSDTACQIAFLSAVKSLQERAVTEGGNAVVNIHSYYKGVPEWSQNTYHCEDGHIITAVTLRGTIVKK